MKLEYRPDIDGLRALAVISVVIYHADIRTGSGQILPGGYLGVDIFFVISGFLITSLIINERERNQHFSIYNFYARRARRLLPALLTVLVLTLPLAWKLLLPPQLVDYCNSLLASLFFSSNIYWLSTMQEYGAESGLLRPLLHTWTLAVEEQYYFIYPLMLLCIYRWATQYTISLLSTCLLASMLLSEWMTQQNAILSFYILPTRFWELLAGGLLAHVPHRPTQAGSLNSARVILSALGLYLMAYSITVTKFDLYNPGPVTWVPVIGVVLVIYFADSANPITKLLSCRPLVAIGLISYSIYLWHYPIFSFARIHHSELALDDISGLILLTFAASIITYFLIEQPFRKKARIPGRRFGAIILAASLLLIVFSLYAIQTDGIKSRFPLLTKAYGKNELDNKLLEKRSWSILNTLAEHQGYPASSEQAPSEFERKVRWFSETPDTVKVLIAGDSHSKDLFNALYLNRAHFHKLEFSRFALSGSLFEEQINDLYNSRNFVAADVIIFTFRYIPKTLERLPVLIDRIQTLGKAILLTSNTVEFLNPDNKPLFDWYVMENLADSVFSVTEINETFYNNRNLNKLAPINAQVQVIAKTYGVRYLEKSDLICNKSSKQCFGVTPDEYKSFYDYGHYTLEGAKFFGERAANLNWLGDLKPDPLLR